MVPMISLSEVVITFARESTAAPVRLFASGTTPMPSPPAPPMPPIRGMPPIIPPIPPRPRRARATAARFAAFAGTNASSWSPPAGPVSSALASSAAFAPVAGLRNRIIVIFSGVIRYSPRSPSTTTGLSSMLPMRVCPPSISTLAARERSAKAAFDDRLPCIIVPAAP